MMFPIENFDFAKKVPNDLRKVFARRVRIRSEIGMVKETFAADFQFGAQFAKISFDDLLFRVNKRIKTKNEVDRLVRQHRQ